MERKSKAHQRHSEESGFPRIGERTRLACRFRRLAETIFGQAMPDHGKSSLGEAPRPHARRARSPEFSSHAFHDQLCCCNPLMMLISGMNSAMTIVPTTNARKTIIIGSSIEVSAATELSTSSS